MELIQTGAEQVYNVTAEQDGWKVNASVSVDEGRGVPHGERYGRDWMERGDRGRRCLVS